MKKSSAEILHKLYYSLSANFINLIVSIFISFFIPKFLGLEEYGYWQLYLFYISYLGFFYFGLADGIYLRYGGYYYEDLDKGLMHSQYVIITVIEGLIFVLIAYLTFLFEINPEKKFINIAIGINCLIVLPRAVIQFIFQATGRIKAFASNLMLERIVYLLLVFAFVITGFKNVRYLIIADILAKIIAVFHINWESRDIIWTRSVKFKLAVSEFYKNISSGLFLLLANISGMLIIGILRFGIEKTWDVITFGKISFSLSISSFLLTFISAISVIIFPLLKRSNQERLPQIYATFETLLSIIVSILMISIFPLQKLLISWLPNYTEAIQYFSILFPICLFESRSTLLINTYLKAMRKEKVILYLNLISLSASLLLTYVIVIVFKNLLFAIFSIVLLYIMRCIIPDIYLKKCLSITHNDSNIWDIVLAVAFIFSNWFIGNITGWLIYIGFVFLLSIINKKKYVSCIHAIKTILV